MVRIAAITRQDQPKPAMPARNSPAILAGISLNARVFRLIRRLAEPGWHGYLLLRHPGPRRMHQLLDALPDLILQLDRITARDANRLADLHRHG